MLVFPLERFNKICLKVWLFAEKKNHFQTQDPKLSVLQLGQK